MVSIVFWQNLEKLIASSQVVIDRPKGTRHPRYPDFIYPLDYGYLQDTQSMDEGGMDVWRGSESGMALSGVICTVDVVKRDSEIKILLGCTTEEVDLILQTHNSGLQGGVFIPNPRIKSKEV